MALSGLPLCLCKYKDVLLVVCILASVWILNKSKQLVAPYGDRRKSHSLCLMEFFHCRKK